MIKRAIVTTPLFYVNSAPHIGHAYSAVLADALNRWQKPGSRLLVGTDEHGQKIFQAAKTNQKETKAFCDEISATFRSCFDTLGIDYDAYIRTTSAEHEQTVRALWSRLRPNIELGNHEGWYCASDEAFVPSTNVDESARVLKDTRHAVEWVSEPNYRFRYNPQALKSALEKHCAILPGTIRRNEVLGLLGASGEEQWISVSRPRHRVPWALEVPGDPSQSIYVWVDALAGYITASGSVLDPDPSHPAFIESQFQNVTHIVGKDILKFHCIHWPAFLLAAGIDVPAKVIAHAHWTVNKTKMSKSLKNVVSPTDLLNGLCKQQPDALRYFLLRDGRLEDDADFSPNALIERCDSDLADNVGNLLNRVCAESMWGVLDGEDTVIASSVQSEKRRRLFGEVDEYYSQADFGRGLELVMRFMNDANADFQQKQPWLDARTIRKSQDEGSKQRLRACLGNSMDACRTAALLLSPVAPLLSKKMMDRLQLAIRPGETAKDAVLRDVVYRRPLLQGEVLLTKLGLPLYRTKAS